MGRQGPCFHCGIEDSLIWRRGPAQKPVLCNACGSRWKIKGNLNAYFPKHKNIKRSKRKKLPLDEKPAIPVIVPDHKKLNREGKVMKIQNCSASSEDGANSCRSECMVSSLTDCTQMESIAGTDSFQELEWKLNIPKKRRSYRRILTPIERFHRQLIRVLHEQKFSHINEEYPLSFVNNNWMMAKNETRAGAVLQYPPLNRN